MEDNKSVILHDDVIEPRCAEYQRVVAVYSSYQLDLEVICLW